MQFLLDNNFNNSDDFKDSDAFKDEDDDMFKDISMPANQERVDSKNFLYFIYIFIKLL